MATDLNIQKDKNQYDVAVIGGGPGGYVAAIRAAQLGAKVALFEKDHIGGTCLNKGCIPTKALAKNAEIISLIRKGRNRGLIIGDVQVDMEKTIDMKNDTVNQLANGISGILKSYDINLIKGEAIIAKDKTIQVGSEKYTVDKIILATGSIPALPPIDGINSEGVITSDELLNLTSIPEHLIVVGGGVIGLEFANIFKLFGSQVTVIEMQPNLIPNMDTDLATETEKILSNQDIKIHLNTTVTKIAKQESQVEVIIDKKGTEETISGDKVLISVGRTPSTKGLENLDLRVSRNAIEVNEYLETNIDGVYAIGDVTAKNMLAHVASHQGIIAAENALGRKKKMKYNVIPSCIYTIPEISSVGLTEAQARKQYGEIQVGRFPLYASGKAFAMGSTEGFVKIISEPKYGEILGCHIIGPNATEIIAEVAMVMSLEGTVDEIIDTIHAHPTMAESIMEAAHDITNSAIHLPKKRG